jgi:hypothetical protein
VSGLGDVACGEDMDTVGLGKVGVGSPYENSYDFASWEGVGGE